MKKKRDRVFLKPISFEDSKDVFENFTETVTKYMYPQPNKDLGATQIFIESCMKNALYGIEKVFTIRNKTDNTFIGVVGLHNLKTDCPEIGIWTSEKSFGNKYGQEAVELLIDMAKLAGYKKILYPVDERNIPSRKIPESFGGTTDKKVKIMKALGDRELQIIDYYIDLV